MPSTLFGDDCNSLSHVMFVVVLFGVGVCFVGLAWSIDFIIGHPGWLTTICLLTCLVACVCYGKGNLAPSSLPSGESPPEPSPARVPVPGIFLYGGLESESRSGPDPQAPRYTAPEPCPAPHRYQRSPPGPSNFRNGQPGISSGWASSVHGASSARSWRGPLTPSPGSEFLRPRVFVEPRRQSNYSYFNAPRPASPIFPPTSNPNPSYGTSYQQPHSEPPTPAYHHSVGLGERIPFSSPPLTLADLAPPRYPASPLWAPRSPKEVDGLGPNVPGQRTLPPAPISSYMHRPRVSIAEAIRLRMDFDDMRISPVPAEDQDYDMRGPGMGDMDVDQMDFNDIRIAPVPAEDQDYDMRGPGMGDMDVDQRVVIAQDVKMSSAVVFEEDVVMSY